ncbi:MAG: CDP-alcohol phosphatidyltransferase family protein [Planctomycetaceae bacterium]|nr:CDP-alcohol phosphatidyltransferase family protein [Planctomycetaceae bacterium]
MMSQFNYFSESEQQSQQRFKQLRDSLLNPLVRGMSAIGLTPNLLSLLGLLVLAPFVWLLLQTSEPAQVRLAFWFLILHVGLDGLDGPLARHQGKSGPAGTLVDMVCDHLGMVVVSITLIQVGLLHAALGSVYVFLYTTSVVFIVVLNQIERPFRFVFRSKYVLYGILLCYAVFNVNYLDTAVILFVLSDLVVSIRGFGKLYGWLEESRAKDNSEKSPNAAEST